MHENDPIEDLAAFHVSNFFRSDKQRQQWLESISNHLGNNFVYDTTEGDWPVLVKSCEVVFFGYEGNENSIERGKKPVHGAGFLDKLPYIVLYEAP